MTSETFKNKILPVIITAFLSALITALQALIQLYTNSSLPVPHVENSFALAGAFKAFYVLSKV